MAQPDNTPGGFNLAWVLLLCLTFFFSGSAGAVVLYGTSTGFGTGGNANGAGGGGNGPGTGPGNFSQFHQIDLGTGVATQISSDIGYGGDVGGLAADSNNVLYAGSGGRGPNDLGRLEDESLFFTIDPVTGSVRVEGRESAWVGPSPAAIGKDVHEDLTNGEEIAPRIETS